MFQLAVCAEMLFRNLPFVERVKEIDRLGFQVEMWNWTSHDIPELEATGIAISSMTGYTEGDLISEDGSKALLKSAERSIEVGMRLGSPRLNLHGTGLGADGMAVRPTPVVTGAMWLAAYKTLSAIAELGRRADMIFCLENLNTRVDHPGVPFSRASETLTLVKAVDSPYLRMNLDLYHVQVDEGSLIQTIQESLPYIGEIQVADTPGRFEPGTGEINYPAISRALARSGYRGVVGLEGWPSSDDATAVERFRSAFSHA